MKKLARLVARNIKPKFARDCEACLFVGRLDGQDLYLCGGDGSYLRRYGNEESQNGSLGRMAPEGSAYALIRELVRREVLGNEYRSMPLLEMHEDDDLLTLQGGF